MQSRSYLVEWGEPERILAVWFAIVVDGDFFACGDIGEGVKFKIVLGFFADVEGVGLIVMIVDGTKSQDECTTFTTGPPIKNVIVEEGLFHKRPLFL